jgi:hypothetical protein
MPLCAQRVRPHEAGRRNDAFDRVSKVEYLVHARVHVHADDEEGKKDYVWADLDTLLATSPQVDMDPEDLSEMLLAYEKRMARRRGRLCSKHSRTMCARPPQRARLGMRQACDPTCAVSNVLVTRVSNAR